MGNITKNLSRYEAECPCGCGIAVCHKPLADMVQGCADWFSDKSGRPLGIKVTSWCRCKDYNDELRRLYHETNGKKGANTSKDSRHTYFDAIDHRLYYKDNGEAVPNHLIYKYYDKKLKGMGGVARYSTFIHLDFRPRNPWRKP